LVPLSFDGIFIFSLLIQTHSAVFILLDYGSAVGVCVSLSIIFIFFLLYCSRKRTVATYYILYIYIIFLNGCTQGNERFPSFLPPSSSYFIILNFQSRNRFANIFISEKGYNNGMGGEIVMKKNPAEVCVQSRSE